MPLSEDAFLDVYADYVESVIKPLEKIVWSELRSWRRDGYWAKHSPFPNSALPRPIQRVRVRVKRPESVLDKIRRLPDEFPAGPSLDSLLQMRDLLGARVITYFPSHLAMVDREIRSNPRLNLSEVHQPKSYLPMGTLESIGLDPAGFVTKGQKPSGYSSIHYTLSIPATDADLGRPFELQTRTMLEETWGEIEHTLGYKSEKLTEFSVKRQFRVISAHLAAIDTHFDFLYDHLTFTQSLSKPEDGDLLNAENFPAVLAEFGITCEQGAIRFLLEILEIHGVVAVADLRRRARLDIVEAIRSVFRAERDGREPTATDIVPVLAKVHPGATTAEAQRQLRSNLRMTDLNTQLRQKD